jgi:hypothetical protein
MALNIAQPALWNTTLSLRGFTDDGLETRAAPAPRWRAVELLASVLTELLMLNLTCE